IIVSPSRGAHRALMLAAGHPERVEGAVFICPATPMGGILPERRIIEFFDDVLPHDESWAKYNRHYWMRDYPGFFEFFFENALTEPNSRKQRENAFGGGLGTPPEPWMEPGGASGLAE